jgi:predicted Ser/Thr protein kinase
MAQNTLTKIGKYDVVEVLGKGGMGIVYKATDSRIGRLVAIKMMTGGFAENPDLLKRFYREAQSTGMLQHPNIVIVYDLGDQEGNPYLVMEYLEGEPLDKMIATKRELSMVEKLGFIIQCCTGLNYAHQRGIVHRDIKPANLMVDQQGHLKILDFGIARVTGDNRTRFGPLTQVNMMIGTPGYMSPEQFEAGEIDHRSDIFAVGAVCYELLAYSEAFAGADTIQVERRVLAGKPAPLATLVPGIDPEIDEIIQRALKKDPNKRYQDAATLEKALEKVCARLGTDDPPQLPRPTLPPLQSAGGKSRAVRAEAAYQRALEASRGNARDAARRFAVEALAEDPSHAAARAFLAGLERSPAAPTQAASRVPAPPTAVGGTAVGGTAIGGTSVGGVGATAVGGGMGTFGGRTAVSSSQSDQTSAFSSAPTIIVTPGAGKPPAAAKPNRFQAMLSGGSKDAAKTKAQVRPPEKRKAVAGESPAALLMRHRWTALAVAVPLLVVLIALVIYFGGGFGAGGQQLTITKPTGGTLSAAGIRCGTRGADCTVSHAKGDVIELTPEADAGFTFAGYTGDCAPVGRTIMTTARTCGATFTQNTVDTAAAAGPRQTLTITPPTGGTLEGVDILCGTKGSICSANHPDGVPVELHPTADPGYTFMGFTGDCVPLGHTQMTAPRTCGATFSLTEIVSKQPPIKPSPSSVARKGSGETPPPTPSQPSTPAAVPAPPVVVPPPAPQARQGRGPVVDPTLTTQKPVAPPPTDEEFAKTKIQELVKDYCAAEEALDPAAVQKLYPKVNMNALIQQLNKSKYRSVQCKFGDLVFVSLDAAAGKAKVQAPLKRVYEHTILTEKPQISELIANLTLARSGLRDQWQIAEATFAPAPPK